MACLVNQTTNNNTNNFNGTILGLLKRIDKMQKEAVGLDQAGSCNTCIFAPAFNTKPIAVYTCNGLLTVNTTPLAEAEAVNVFRVENILNDETVVLRLITVIDDVYTCTLNTITMKISCICAIQCFDSINCTLCNQINA